VNTHSPGDLVKTEASNVESAGRSDLQFAEFHVSGLFGRLEHSVAFPHGPEDATVPSISILHGPNGVGKTTVLRMLDGLMSLNFDIYREVPFNTSTLSFTDGTSISVEKDRHDEAVPLVVRYGSHRAELDPSERGALTEQNRLQVEIFRRDFFSATESIKFEFIGTARTGRPYVAGSRGQEAAWSREEALLPDPVLVRSSGRASSQQRAAYESSRSRAARPLSRKVATFINDAQVDFRRFFTSNEPDLFARLLLRLGQPVRPGYTADDLMQRLARVRGLDEKHRAMGLAVDRWDYSMLVDRLGRAEAATDSEALRGFIGAYVEVLESGADQRGLLADRLRTFERVLNEFYLNKRVSVSARKGFQILTDDGTALNEEQLSSGEYHLLYLMVSALVTTRRGTVLAIDEPELSMHITWQRKLIQNLIKCASNANPQFIFATHSPDIVSHYQDSLTEFQDDYQTV
jgi:ABC-type lipoprotein export system ATPase subunit